MFDIFDLYFDYKDAAILQVNVNVIVGFSGVKMIGFDLINGGKV